MKRINASVIFIASFLITLTTSSLPEPSVFDITLTRVSEVGENKQKSFSINF